MKRFILLCLVFVLAVVGAAAGAVAWEPVDPIPVEMNALSEQVETSDAGVNILVRDGKVYAIVGRQVNVKVFTILGQLVSQQTLRQGVYRLNLPSKGIYILRAGSLTRRITL